MALKRPAKDTKSALSGMSGHKDESDAYIQAYRSPHWNDHVFSQ
jgi:hypothetical protein